MLAAIVISLAQETPQWTLTEVIDYWRRGESAISIAWFYAFAGALAAITGAAALWRWREKRLTEPGPMLLFRRIAAEVGLDSDEQRVLARIARHGALASPLTLMVAAGTFDHYAASCAASLGDHQRADFGRQVDALRARLFAA